jgi:hypothetical protein
MTGCERFLLIRTRRITGCVVLSNGLENCGGKWQRFEALRVALNWRHCHEGGA